MNRVEIDITGLPKGAVLAALFNAAAPQGRGMLLRQPEEMTAAEGQRIIDEYGTKFDYVNGRPLKVDLAGDSFDPRLYDRDVGMEGAAEVVLERIRKAA